MSRRNNRWIAGLAVIAAVWLIWSRLHVVVWVQASFWQIVLVIVVVAAVVYLVVDHLINRTRG